MNREPVMRRIRADQRASSPFRDPGQRTFLIFGGLLLAFLTSLPFWADQWTIGAERMATLASLFFLVAAGGQAFGLKARSFLVSFLVVAFLYVATAWTWFVFDLEDFFILAVIVSFLIFIMAGFYITLLLEDGVAWVQDRVSPEEPQGSAVMLLTSAVMMGVLPALGAYVIWLKWLWIASVVGVAILGSWWLVHIKKNLHPDPVMHDLDLLIAGILAAVGLAEVVTRFREQAALPGILAYGALLLTWFYLSYMTVRRTQVLIKHRDPGPWISILFAAAFSVVAHALRRFRFDAAYAADSLLGQRIVYLEAGIWIGITYFALRSSWTALKHIRDNTNMSPKSRRFARAAARVTEEILEVEQKMDKGTSRFFHGVDEAIGRRKTKEKRKRMR